MIAVRYLTTQQAADRMGIAAVTVRALIAQGKLRADRLGSIWAIDPDSIKGFSRSPRGRKRKQSKQPQPVGV